jgi:alcohol dehydrogenase (cytochrome c)
VTYLKLLSGLPIALVVAQGLHVESTPYVTVTDARLERPEAGDWLMYRRTYDGSGFSPLRQINTGNVAKLSLAWSLNTNLVEAHETTPIVNHGRMLITTPGNNVIALDAKTGTQL